MEIRFSAVGPDRFCPDCGRWLVRVKEGGSFDLAAEASIDQQATMTYDEMGQLEEPREVEAIIVAAHCLRCNPEEKRKDPPYEQEERRRSDALWRRIVERNRGRRN